MIIKDRLYIDGQWVSPTSTDQIEVINPANRELYAKVPSASIADVEQAIQAAHKAFDSWSQTSAEQRSELIHAIADQMHARRDELALAITSSMGCPLHLSYEIQVDGAIEALRSYAERAFIMEQVESHEGFDLVHEAVGVCVLITPWNYPLSQLVGKIAPAIAAGCTMVVKPAEQTPIQDFIMAEILDQVGVPAGVFNLVSGYGHQVGAALCGHPLVDMISFTGSTAAGVKVSQAAAPGIKRVCLELGGKSPYIITQDADLAAAVRYGVKDVMINSGQTCTALTRMLVPESRYQEALELAKAEAEEQVVGDPLDPASSMGPLSSWQQKDRVQTFIALGQAEGARLITGGNDVPAELADGAYVMPTIFADVTPQMQIAREEIFGPVLCILPYRDLAHAIEMANDTPYGLSSSVYASNREQAARIARRLRAGQCYLQGAYFNSQAPFGGFKQSGNGREWGDAGLMEFVEVKSVIG